MAEDKRFPPEEQEQQEGKGRLSLHNLFYHNTFVLIFSFVVSVIAWFIMYQYSGESRTYMVYDVPITTLYSSEAEAEGLRDRFIVICGGARVSHELAKELGFDAGFGAGTYADDVASFAVTEMVKRGMK